MTPPPPPSEKRWLPEESLPAETAATLARSRDWRAKFARATAGDALRLAMQAPAMLESLESVVLRVAAELPTGDLARARRPPIPRPKSLSPEVIALVEDVARRFLRENSVVIEEADIVGGGGK